MAAANPEGTGNRVDPLLAVAVFVSLHALISKGDNVAVFTVV
jgi:hypothetical protein